VYAAAMNQRHIAWVERGPDDKVTVISENSSRDPKTCSHSYVYDEPPQCALCGSWVCGMCKVRLRHPVGLCNPCAEDAASGKA